jgi:hypothetical protein
VISPLRIAKFQSSYRLFILDLLLLRQCLSIRQRLLIFFLLKEILILLILPHLLLGLRNNLTILLTLALLLHFLFLHLIPQRIIRVLHVRISDLTLHFFFFGLSFLVIVLVFVYP